MQLQKIGLISIFLLCAIIANQYKYKTYYESSIETTLPLEQMNMVKEPNPLQIDILDKSDPWVKQMLKDIKKEDWLADKEKVKVQKLEGDFIGDKNIDQIWALTGEHQKETLFLLYENYKGKYQYRSFLEVFGEVKEIKKLAIRGVQKDLLLIKEYINELLGAFEESTRIKAYDWREKKPTIVLDIIEDYHAYWNELWDHKKPKNESHWLQIVQHSDVQWQDELYPVLHVISHQVFSTSKATDQVDMPKEEDFQIQKTKEIKRDYRWDPSWNGFILAEGIDTQTGEKVAILEDLSDTPFTLVGFVEDAYRIKRKNGSIEEVPKGKIHMEGGKKELQVS
ncbi:MAG: hypothetical protein GX962_11305 [Epulopiscium sp.]|nr:hypothetical protein [Candidatus Epulonipiscium sp.]